ncbi:MAG: DUF523 and DUF1722 domain-containing protein [Bdellovibrionota bacterium]
MTARPKIRLGVSSCLLGEKVRYDGGHKRDSYVVKTLGRFFELIPICPEVEIGMGVPREPIQLERAGKKIRAVGVKDRELDVTEKLSRYGRKMARELEGLGGYVFKSGSPSCGLFGVNIYPGKRGTAKNGRGLYAEAFLEGQPFLPTEEEGRLGDPDLRDNFFERVFAYYRWQRASKKRFTVPRLVSFHAAHELQLLSHGERRCWELGRLAVRGDKAAYLSKFMQALGEPAAKRGRAGALRHAMECIKGLGRDERSELAGLIQEYQRGRLPLSVPFVLLRRYLGCHPVPSLAAQTFLHPEPLEAAVRRMGC